MINKSFFLILLTLVSIIVSPTVLQAQVVSGSQIKGQLQLTYPLVYLTNQIAQDRVNADIAKQVEAAKASYFNYYIDKVRMNYEVKMEDENNLSLLINTYKHFRKATHEDCFVAGIVYNKNTGQRIPLTNQLQLKNVAQLENLLLQGTVKAYNQHAKELDPRRLLMPRKISPNYYLKEDGSIVNVYNPFELTNYENGVIHIVFTPEAIKQINEFQLSNNKK